MRGVITSSGAQSPADPAPGLPPGEPRLGRWILGELLASEGGIVVYAARDEAGREARLEILSSRHPELRERFEREARAAAAIDHPGVARVLEVEPGRPGDLPWRAVARPHGRTLATIVETLGPLPPEIAAAMGADAAAVLQAAHRASVIHRAVDPQHILIDDRGRVLLVGFGLERVAEAAGAGARAYRAPEQVAGQQVDARADVYGLGATVAFASGAEPGSAPRGAVDLAAVLVKATATHRADRHLTIAELEGALREVAGGRMADDVAAWLRDPDAVRWRLAAPVAPAAASPRPPALPIALGVASLLGFGLFLAILRGGAAGRDQAVADSDGEPGANAISAGAGPADVTPPAPPAAAERVSPLAAVAELDVAAPVAPPPPSAPPLAGPPPGPPMAEVWVRVRPACTVFLDGVEVGRSPLATPLTIEPGAHLLACIAEDGNRMTAPLDVTPGQTVTVDRELRAPVAVRIEIDGADLDGFPVGYGSIVRVNEGPHRIRASGIAGIVDVPPAGCTLRAAPVLTCTAGR